MTLISCLDEMANTLYLPFPFLSSQLQQNTLHLLTPQHPAQPWWWPSAHFHRLHSSLSGFPGGPGMIFHDTHSPAPQHSDWTGDIEEAKANTSDRRRKRNIVDEIIKTRNTMMERMEGEANSPSVSLEVLIPATRVATPI
jgi:hypothetical protein